MLLHAPFTTVTASVDGDVLHVLASSSDEFTVARLARLIPDRSISGIRNTADRLSGQGVVRARTIGRVRVYALNDRHLVADSLRAIAGIRVELLRRMATHVEAWEYPPLFGALFGSGARGEMTIDSDLDVFLLCEDGDDEHDWGTTIGDFEGAITDWTGNDARVVEIHLSDIRATTNRSLIAEVVRDGIGFFGDVEWLRKAIAA